MQRGPFKNRLYFTRRTTDSVLLFSAVHYCTRLFIDSTPAATFDIFKKRYLFWLSVLIAFARALLFRWIDWQISPQSWRVKWFERIRTTWLAMRWRWKVKIIVVWWESFPSWLFLTVCLISAARHYAAFQGLGNLSKQAPCPWFWWYQIELFSRAFSLYSLYI